MLEREAGCAQPRQIRLFETRPEQRSRLVAARPARIQRRNPQAPPLFAGRQGKPQHFQIHLVGNLVHVAAAMYARILALGADANAMIVPLIALPQPRVMVGAALDDEAVCRDAARRLLDAERIAAG